MPESIRDLDEERAAVDALAKRALSEWGLEDAKCALHTQSENAVYRVESASGDVYALRVHREGYHDLSELESEHVWTTELARVGLFVPEAVSTLSGRPYATVEFPNARGSTTRAPRHVGIVKWIEGDTLRTVIARSASSADISGLFEKLGALIAAFHRCTSKWTPPSHFRRHAWDTEGLVGETPFWGRFWEIETATDEERSRLLRIRNALKDKLSGLERGPEAYGMIHADMHSNNVLVDGDRLTVIDFDDAGFGWYIHDLAVCLYPELDVYHKETPHFDVARDALIRGYRNHREFNESQIQLLSWFILVRALLVIRWAEDRPESGMVEAIPFFKSIAFERADELGLV